MKLKKIISLAACTIVFASCMCINVSAANTSDTQTQYVWSSSKKYDYTNARVKSDNSVVYLHPINEYRYHTMVSMLEQARTMLRIKLLSQSTTLVDIRIM